MESEEKRRLFTSLFINTGPSEQFQDLSFRKESSRYLNRQLV